jgi:competence protein ComEA
MKKFIKDYFTFSKKERNGTLILVGIIALLIAYPLVKEIFFSGPPPDYSLIKPQIEEFMRIKAEQNSSIKEYQAGTFNANNSRNSFYKKEHFHFDPNTASPEDWERLGLKPKLIKTITNYLSKGGKFYKKEDLKRIYGMPERTFLELEPYIKFKTSAGNNSPEPAKEKEKPVAKLLELNQADTIELIKLKGIGPAFASRIFKYRKKLGGFIKKEQLLEVYGLDEEKYREIENFVQVNPVAVRRINVNVCSIEDLSKHPYIPWNIANSIVRYREHHGKYSELSEIMKSDLVNEELYLKIAGYLTIE